MIESKIDCEEVLQCKGSFMDQIELLSFRFLSPEDGKICILLIHSGK